MTYFAIGESTGGAGERRLGPFETPEEAAQAGRKETRESNGGFVFRGVVDEANNQVGFDIEPIVSTNSVVRNAMAVRNAVARNAEAHSVASKVSDRIREMSGVILSIINDLELLAGPKAPNTPKGRDENVKQWASKILARARDVKTSFDSLLSVIR